MDIATSWEVKKNIATREMQYARRRFIRFLTKSANTPIQVGVPPIRVQKG
jgi:hypothetical protein